MNQSQLITRVVLFEKIPFKVKYMYDDDFDGFEEIHVVRLGICIDEITKIIQIRRNYIGSTHSLNKTVARGIRKKRYYIITEGALKGKMLTSSNYEKIKSR